MIDYAGLTDKGMTRKSNQDFYAVNAEVPYTFVVCDGMGGHASGDVASRCATEGIIKFIKMHAPLDMDEKSAGQLLGGSIKYANSIVYERAKFKENKGMGTTADVCLVDFGMLYIAHVGDGRVYLFREGVIKQITTDHTLVHELIKNGTITEIEAETHPGRHMITRAVGTDSSVKWDFICEKLQPGDIIMMCTDGLYNMLCDRELKNTLISSPVLQEVSETLVQKANDKGGGDNITAVLIRYEEDEK